VKITVLGCLGAYPYKGEGTTGYLVESDGFHLLLDAGSTTLVQLEKILDPLDLDAVILTHYHHDHIADLGVLQYYWQLYPENEERQVLPIYGHGEDRVHFESLTL
jgi:ribonuclease BN (tRNA processing enzyme)